MIKGKTHNYATPTTEHVQAHAMAKDYKFCPTHPHVQIQFTKGLLRQIDTRPCELCIANQNAKMEKEAKDLEMQKRMGEGNNHFSIAKPQEKTITVPTSYTDPPPGPPPGYSEAQYCRLVKSNIGSQSSAPPAPAEESQAPQPAPVHVYQSRPRTFRNGLCDCCGNCNYCLYVTCCMTCAIGDLRSSFTGSGGMWWSTVFILELFFILGYIPHIGLIFYLIGLSIATSFLMSIARQIREKLSMKAEDDCCNDCCESFFCACCKTIQIGRELEDVEDPRVKELLLNIQKASPCGNDCIAHPV